jgi:hypothetical protein
MKKIFITMIMCSFISTSFAAQVTDFSMSDAVLKEKKGDIGVWQKTDGTVITVYKDRSEAKLPDGSRIVKYPDGRREVFYSDGKIIMIDEAKGTREYKDSSKNVTVKFTGMTPFGDKIPRVEKIIQKEPLVRMIYLPERSDEMLDPGSSNEPMIWEIKLFFDELYDRVRQKYINAANDKKVYTGAPYDIQVSFCRYCSTGYCFEKQGGVTVEFVSDGKIMKSFFLDRMALRDKGKRGAFVLLLTEFAPLE